MPIIHFKVQLIKIAFRLQKRYPYPGFAMSSIKNRCFLHMFELQMRQGCHFLQCDCLKPMGFCTRRPLKYYPYQGFAISALEYLWFSLDCEKPLGFCVLHPLQLRSLLPIRNICGHEPVVFCICWLRKCTTSGSKRKLQKANSFFKFVVQNRSIGVTILQCDC